MNHKKEQTAAFADADKTQMKVSKIKNLKLSENYYATLLNSINEAIVVSQEGKFLYYNKQFIDLLGYNSSELQKLNYNSIFSLDIIDFFYEREILKTQGIDVPSHYETVLKRKNGTELDVEVNISFMNYKDKPSIVSIIRDIKKRKSIENNLIERESVLRTIMNFTPSALFIIKGEHLIYVNKAAEEICGYKAADLQSKKFWDIVHPDFKEIVKMRGIARQKGFNVTNHYEFKIINAENKELWVEYMASQITFNGEIAILGTGLDITKRKNAEEALIESEKRNKALLKAIPDLVFRFNDQDNLLDFHVPSVSVLPFSQRVLMDKSLHDVFSKELLDRIISAKKRAFKSGSTEIFEAEISLQKETFCEEIRVVTFDKNEYVIIMRDITERKRNEEQIRVYIEELKNKQNQLQKSTKELAELNTKLHDSEQKLIKLNANKDKFFSIISHDLKSPFISLIGFAEMLTKEYETMDVQDIRAAQENIYRSASGIYNLLENLLQWSRIQTDRIEFSPVIFNFHSLVKQVINIFTSNAQNKNITIINRLKFPLIVYADKNMIDTVLRNLLSNAIKFTPQNGRIIIASQEKKNDVILSVTDSGTGMDKETKIKLFRIDELITKEGTDKEKGTGLGLILCKEFVEKNRGKIWIDPKRTRGSKFMFSVPKP